MKDHLHLKFCHLNNAVQGGQGLSTFAPLIVLHLKDLVLRVSSHFVAEVRSSFVEGLAPTVTPSPHLRVGLLPSPGREERRRGKRNYWKSVLDAFFDNLLGLRRGRTEIVFIS